jgi:hypothetical protein
MDDVYAQLLNFAADCLCFYLFININNQICSSTNIQNDIEKNKYLWNGILKLKFLFKITFIYYILIYGDFISL